MLDTLATLAGMQYQIHHGDCRDVMASLDAESVDAIVSDPPYGLSLLGNSWDHGVPGVEFWTKALRVAKTGAHLLAFGGTRTYHRLACAIEDAGWEIRDCVMWVYGSGFPKSHNLKGEWQGWGTALKPAWEPIIVARKPLCDTVAENVLRHGTGAINVDGCRVEGSKPETTRGRGGRNGRYSPIAAQGRILDDGRGRWPANVIHDGSDEVVSLFPQTKTGGQVPDRAVARNTAFLCGLNGQFPHAFAGDSGSAARFFYCAKASHEDRDEGCEGLGDKTAGVWDGEENDLTAGKKRVLPAKNHHPTVKPTALMRYLCRLVTPPGGVVLDPFTGSGSTGKAAILEGFRFIGIEREAEYVEIAKARIAAADSVAGPLFARN